MKVVKFVWRILVGGVVTFGGWFLVQGQLEETVMTVATVIGIGLIAVGASILAGVLD